MKKLFKQKLLSKVVVSTEDALPYKEPEPVNTDPDTPLQPDDAIVTSPDIIDAVEDELKAIESDLIAIESLASVPAVLASVESHAEQERVFLLSLESTLSDPHAARRILATTVTGGISCTADIISLEDTTANAARTHWDNLASKINKLANKNIGLVDDSESVGSTILEKMKGLKKQVQSYKGGKTANVGRIVGPHKLDDLIRNTQVAIQEDIGMKISFPLDSAVDDLSRMAAKAIGSGAADGLAQITAKGVKQADQLATQYKIRDPEFPILGYQRKTMDDQITLPQGIVMALSGSGRKYNYPRYGSLKGSGKNEVELSSQQVKQLYDIGMFIGREIAEQSRVWEFRLGTLKALGELVKKESRNVDADRNTWAAEQKAATSVVRMWATNAAARRHYVATHNKIAYLIYDLLSKVTGSTIEPSQEVLGGLFGKKSQVPETSMEEKFRFIRENISNTRPITNSGISVNVDKTISSKNIYSVILNELSLYAKYFNPTTIDRMYSTLEATIQKTESNPNLDPEVIWVDFYMRIKEDHIFTPEKIFGMVKQNKLFTTPYSFLTNLQWLPEVPEFTYVKHDTVLELPTVDTTLIKRILPAIEKIWMNKVDSSIDRNVKCDPKCLWGANTFREFVTDPMLEVSKVNNDLLSKLIDVLYMSVQPPTVSQEFFGPFKKKPKEEPKVEVKPRSAYIAPKAMLTKLPKASIDSNVSHNLIAYSNNFPEHVKLLTKAAAEVNAKFNIANIRKFGVELNKLADRVMETFKYGDADDNWMAEGNKALQMLLTEVEEQRLWGRFFGVDNIGGVFETSFKTASNVRWDNKESTVRIPNSSLGNQSVSGVDLASATQLCKLIIAFPDPSDVNGIVQNNQLLKSFPKFDDAMYYHFEEPIQDVLMQLDDIIGHSYDLVLQAIETDPGDHEYR